MQVVVVAWFGAFVAALLAADADPPESASADWYVRVVVAAVLVTTSWVIAPAWRASSGVLCAAAGGLVVATVQRLVREEIELQRIGSRTRAPTHATHSPSR